MLAWDFGAALDIHVFQHPSKQIWTMVHGDDYVTAGPAESLRWMRQELEKRFEVKTQLLGPGGGEGESRTISVLNRILEWRKEGITYEADARHAEQIVQ